MKEPSLSVVNRALAHEFDAFFGSGIYQLPWVQEGIAYAKEHGPFTMPLPAIGPKTHIVFKPEGLRWCFMTSGILTDDYAAVVDGGHWELYRDNGGPSGNLGLLTTDDWPYIRGVNGFQLEAITQDIKEQLAKFKELYLSIPRPAAPPPPAPAQRGTIAVVGALVAIFGVVTLCVLAVLFAHIIAAN